MAGRYRHLHEINTVFVSGTVLRKDLKTRRNGKKAVYLSIENIRISRWGGENVQFKSVIFCDAIGEVARAIWTGIEVGDRIFVQGSISWKPAREMRADKDGMPYGTQVVMVDDVIKMRGEDMRVPTWGAAGIPDYEKSSPSAPQYPPVPIGHMGETVAPDPPEDALGDILGSSSASST